MLRHLLPMAFLLLYAPTFAIQPPSAVTIERTKTALIIKWTSVSAAETYRITRNGKTIASDVHNNKFTDSTVVGLSTYSYAVAACNFDRQCSKPRIQRNNFSIMPSIAGDNTKPLSTVVPVVNKPEQVAPKPITPKAPELKPAPDIPDPEIIVNLIPVQVSVDVAGLLTWTPPEKSIKWNVYQNGKYIDTVSNGEPKYLFADHNPNNGYYVTAIFPDGTISKKSAEVRAPVKHDCP